MKYYTYCVYFEYLLECLFLRIPGVILTNNENKQLIKRAVLNRKNAYFFRNEAGAKIADILMSIIEACVYNNVNPWKYLIVLQEQQADIRRNPHLWAPWCYEKRLRELSPPDIDSLYKNSSAHNN